MLSLFLYYYYYYYYYYCYYYYYYHFDGKRTASSAQDFFSHLLALSNQSGKAIAGQCKVNTWQGAMVSFLGLKSTSMTNQYAPN